MDNNEELVNQETENQAPEDATQQENYEPAEDSQDSEQASAEAAKTFSQDELEAILEKRLAREREGHEKKFNELVGHLQNFGKPQAQEQEQAQQFDTSQPITFDTLIAMQEQAQMDAENAKKNAEFKVMQEQAIKDFPDFKKNTQDHEFTKAVMKNKALADSLEGLDSPFHFMHEGATKHSEELSNILKISDPKKQFAAIVRLDDKIRVQSKVSQYSNAPDSIEDDYESSDSPMQKDDVQSLRNSV